MNLPPKAQTPIDDFIAPVCEAEIQLLYLDEHIALIDKPSGLLSLSGKNPLNKDSVHYRLVQGRVFKGTSLAQNEPFVHARLLHRLDFGTSGIMLVSLNTEANRNLSKQFQDRKIIKRYIAILDGHLEKHAGSIDHPIAKDSINFPKVKICAQTGKPASSEYSVIERLSAPNRTRVQFAPSTGRTHQLRIHSYELGHPILGCDLYKNSESENKASRLMLHASELYFNHPVSAKTMHVHCPCPF